MTANRLTDERGQLLIPALFVLPSMFLFAIMLIETGNLSRQKIRQQFAVDAAASVEMELYTDTLNRLAYLNGVFPDRIFREMYANNYHAYRGNSLYPGSAESPNEFMGKEIWPLRYAGGRGDYSESQVNVPEPPKNFGILHMHLPEQGAVSVEHAITQATTYESVYNSLGEIAHTTRFIFNEATKNHALLRTSLCMNLMDQGETDVGECSETAEKYGDDAVSNFGDIPIDMSYLYGFKHCNTVIKAGGQTYEAALIQGKDYKGSGLWQLAWVPVADLEKLERGYVVKRHWDAPPNYFQVDFNGGASGGKTASKRNIKKKDTGNIDEYSASAETMAGGDSSIDISYLGSETGGPYVRARVTSYGGRVWPDTTPRFVTKMHP